MVKCDNGEIEMVGNQVDISTDIMTLVFCYARECMRRTGEVETVVENFSEMFAKSLSVATEEYFNELEQDFEVKRKMAFVKKTFERGKKDGE